jgi:hypothetical protein
MENEITERPPILEIAWTRFAIFDAAASRHTRGFYWIRAAILWFSVIATAFAIVNTGLFADRQDSLALFVKVFFVAIPIVASGFAAFASRFYGNGNWLIVRAGAEEIKKEIYLYRTIRNKAKRDEIIEKNMATIQRQMYQRLSGEFSFEPYDGSIPPYYNPGEKDEEKRGDSGFNDLTSEEYFKFRLEDQFKWHNKKINGYKQQRQRMVIYILIMGGLGAILAALGGNWSIGVALTSSITAAMIGWQELNSYDSIIRNYSKVVMELTILYDHWKNLPPDARKGKEFERMVEGCETVLWTQHLEFIATQQEVLKEHGLEEEASLIEGVVDKAVETAKDMQVGMREAALEATSQALDTAKDQVVEDFKTTLGTLAEEASSELVQQELAAMREALTDVVESVAGDKSSIFASLAKIAEKFSNTDVGRDTTKEELNRILAEYPKTGEVKG